VRGPGMGRGPPRGGGGASSIIYCGIAESNYII